MEYRISGLKLRALKEGILQQAISIYGFEKDGDKIYIAQPLLIVEESPKDCINPDPICKLSPEMAQSLMDDLWDCGLRPSEGAGSAGALAATQKHLEDMRKLVFDYLNKMMYRSEELNADQSK